jgi:hypothetical protein
MIENTTPCAQFGNAEYNKWCGPAQMYKNINDQSEQ